MLTALPLLDRLFLHLPGSGGDPADAASPTTGGEGDADIVVIPEFEFVLGHLSFVKVVNFRGARRELRLLGFLLSRAPALEQLVLVTVEGEGDEHLEMMQCGRRHRWLASSCAGPAKTAARTMHTRGSTTRNSTPHTTLITDSRSSGFRHRLICEHRHFVVRTSIFENIL
ncbi:hypothetical protein ACP4OV_020528 [Aristida adscensionis]